MVTAEGTTATPSRTDPPSRLRLPNTRLVLPAASEDATAPAVPQIPVNKRTPVVGMRFQGQDPSEAGTETIRHPIRDEHPGDVQRLKAENKELRKLLEEMKILLHAASESEEEADAKEGELQAALAVKSAQIEELTAQLQAVEEQIVSGALTPAPAPVVPKTRTELEEWADDLEQESARLAQERRNLDTERHQLRQDEEALEARMRDMEISMARERALLARQEMELKRLSNEIQQELDMIQRGDSQLREQMRKFQRRAQDVMQGKSGSGGSPPRR